MAISESIFCIFCIQPHCYFYNGRDRPPSRAVDLQQHSIFKSVPNLILNLAKLGRTRLRAGVGTWQLSQSCQIAWLAH